MGFLDELKNGPKINDLIDFGEIKQKRMYKKVLGKEKYNFVKQMVKSVFNTDKFTIDIEDNYQCVNIDLETEKIKCVIEKYIKDAEKTKIEFQTILENQSFYNSSCFFMKSNISNHSSFAAFIRKSMREKKGLARIQIIYKNGEAVKREELNYDDVIKRHNELK